MNLRFMRLEISTAVWRFGGSGMRCCVILWAVAQYSGVRSDTVVKVLCYKLEGRWFDPSWCQWIFHWHKNPSDRTMALGSTQPLTGMITTGISWGKDGRCVRLTTLPSSCVVVTKSGNLNFLEPSGPVQACNGTASLNVHDNFVPKNQGWTFVAGCSRCCFVWNCWSDVNHAQKIVPSRWVQWVVPKLWYLRGLSSFGVLWDICW